MKTEKYEPAPAGLPLTPGAMLRVAREAQEMTQAQLAKESGIPQPTISALESGKESFGVDRAEKLAIALRVHPAVLVWPNWDRDQRTRSVKRSGHGVRKVSHRKSNRKIAAKKARRAVS
ncbi:MAG: helix-turn-helix transcriptional regulator, partial [Polyangiaceae bacterium]